MTNLKFFDLPLRRVTSKDYIQCCDQIISSVKKANLAVAVYLMGGEWVPGVSDLDIVIIYPDKINCQELGKEKIDVGSISGRFILTHRPLRFSENDFYYFNYLYPEKVSNLRLLWGSNVMREKPEKSLPARDYKLLMCSILFDILVNKLLLFPRYLKGHNLDVRRILGELYSLTYSFYILEQIDNTKPFYNIETNKFLSDIKSLRVNWFDNTIDDNLLILMKLLNDGIIQVGGILNKLSGYLSDLEMPMISSQGCFMNRAYSIKFDNINNSSYYRGMGWFRKNYNLSVPANLLSIILSYANGDGLFSKMIAESLVIQSKYEILRSVGIEKHLMALNKVFTTSSQQNGYYKIPFSYGFSIPETNIIRILRLFSKYAF